MSISPLNLGNEPARRKRGAGRIAASLLVLFLLLAGAGWFVWQRLMRTEAQMQTLSARLDNLGAKQDGLAQDIRQAIEQVNTSRRQAQEAETRAGLSESARAEAAHQAEQAQAARTQAEQKARAAQNELSEVRKAREAELNRMQEALSKVASTRRTENGIVIDLSNDSFKFDFDKSTLRPENRELLSRLAGILLASHGFSLYVYGYTDDIGTDEYNLGLSQRRAQAVRDYLVHAGLPSEIISAKGFGKSSPRVKA
ncbi:MAG TPA: OmpA family protein, partial [Bryobacteraceae bacterium]|nr:OmpA family protein [Bryobacteraceae bacterium]